ncbi:MAG: hypothetical protein Q4A92_07630 [Corynebacterium sp.]|nr:hypothetical protein [Corynebacterium sp.]
MVGRAIDVPEVLGSLAQTFGISAVLCQNSQLFLGSFGKEKAQTPCSAAGNYYTGNYPVHFSSKSEYFPKTSIPVGKGLKFISEEEFFAHYLLPTSVCKLLKQHA